MRGVFRDMVDNVYKISFVELPDPIHLKNNKSARENPSLFLLKYKDDCEKQCISKVSKSPIVVNPVTVAYDKSNKPRLVLDCRHINPFLLKFKFKYEDVSIANQ
ncbi:hypothetical protein KUTeg_001045, partial [Tegillarca granosa]